MKKNEDTKILFLEFRKEFLKAASQILNMPFVTSPESNTYNIVAIDESGAIIDKDNLSANYVLCPHSSPCRGKIICNNVISCGMSSKSTFGLSSTNKERSMFSVNRAINLGNELLLPFEEPFKPDKRLSLYENIIIHGIEKLCKPDSCDKFCIIDNIHTKELTNYWQIRSLFV